MNLNETITLQINFRQLLCFQAVLTTGTTKSAAQLLNMSQPAASMAISNLEHQIGFVLFNREKGRLTPTPEAHRFYETVKTALNGFNNIAYVAEEIKQGSSGTITIAAYPGISIKFLPRLVANFIRDKNHLSVKILSHSSRLVRDMIPSQEYDIGILELPINNPAVHTEKFLFKCVCILPPNSELKSKEFITPEDLNRTPYIIPFREHVLYYQILNIFEKHNSNLNIVTEVQYLTSACEIVSTGFGAAIVDPISASYYRGQGVVIKPFYPDVIYGIGVTYSKFHQLSKPAEKFMNTLREHLSNFTAEGNP